MKITKVCCQGCGADLPVDESIRFGTCNYCHARLEIVHDPTVTHTRLLEDIALNTGRSADRLHVLELQTTWSGWSGSGSGRMNRPGI